MPIISGQGGGGSSSGGGVIAHATQANTVSTAAVTYGTGSAVFGADLSFTADGASSYMVQLLGAAGSNGTTGSNINLSLKLDGAQSVFMGTSTAASNGGAFPLAFTATITPSAGVHAVNVVLYGSGGTSKVLALADLTGSTPMLLVVTKLV